MKEQVDAPAEPTSLLVARYAQNFNAVFADGAHSVTSPLGAWLLLCLVAPAATGATRTRLEQLLQMDAHDAFRRATALLDDPHPAVRSAVALWRRPEMVLGVFEDWAAPLPDAVEVGPVPSPEGADQWARRETLGLIDRFPLALAGDAAMVFASVLASKIDWLVPFGVVAASELDGPWAGLVERVLEAPRAHTSLIATTASAGDVAVHAASSHDGLTVVSLIADPAVVPPDVHRAAAEVVDVVVGPGDQSDHPTSGAAVRSLFDLPLGSGHAWTLSESTIEASGPPQQERFRTLIPSWDAQSEHALLSGPVGFREAADALALLCHPDFPYETEAVQVARASFTREGFAAAAVTAMAVVGAAQASAGTVCVRTAEIRFNRPYAATAIAIPPRNRIAPPAWNRVPVFSAWVARPAESE